MARVHEAFYIGQSILNKSVIHKELGIGKTVGYNMMKGEIISIRVFWARRGEILEFAPQDLTLLEKDSN